MYLIYKHLLRTTVGPFFFGLGVITFVLMIQVLFRYVDLFVSKGVPFPLATEVLALSLGHTFALSVPMAVLIAVLMGVGQLAADHEITAMKASGIGLASVLAPLLFGAGLLAVGLTAYNNYVFPESNHRLANLLYDIQRQRPMMEIRPQMFTRLSERLTIHVQHKDDRTGRIEDVTILEKEGPQDQSPRVTTAAWGVVRPRHDADAMLIELHDGEIHDFPDDRDPSKYQVIRFARHDLYLAGAEIDFQVSDRTSRGDREMNLADLKRAAGEQRDREGEVRATTAGLVADLVSRQWGLLDPARRGELLGGSTGVDQAVLASRLRETRQRIEMLATQAGYQEKLRRDYAARANRYLVEYHKKFAIPFACLVFVLLGVPMAVSTSRSGRGISVSLALGVYLVYYLFLVAGEDLADRGRMDPFLAMWLANFVLTALGVPIFLRTVRESSLFSRNLRPRRPSRPATS